MNWRHHPLFHPKMILEFEFHGYRWHWKKRGSKGRTFSNQFASGVSSVGVHLHDILIIFIIIISFGQEINTTCTFGNLKLANCAFIKCENWEVLHASTRMLHWWEEIRWYLNGDQIIVCNPHLADREPHVLVPCRIQGVVEHFTCECVPLNRGEDVLLSRYDDANSGKMNW